MRYLIIFTDSKIRMILYPMLELDERIAPPYETDEPAILELLIEEAVLLIYLSSSWGRL